MTRRSTHGNEITRRAALSGVAGLVLGFHLPAGRAAAQSGATPGDAGLLAPNAFVRIASDDTVTVLVKHIEFGQGPFTGLATLVAEEVDADWSKVRAEHAPSNPELYKNLAFGMQGTGGSTAIANSYEQMRIAGATARAMLVEAAARAWNVPSSEITVDNGFVRHTRSGRSGRLGQFAEAASKLPVPRNVAPKDPARFRLIGREGVTGRLDSPAKSNGTARFTIDIRERGMLTVVVARPPRFGGKLAAFDAAEARAVRGVVDVKEIPSGVAVYAEGMWPALKGRDRLRITWDEAAAEKRSTGQLVEEYLTLARKPGVVAGRRGNPEAQLAQGGGLIEAEYVFPYLAHAPMEPLDGFLSWDGKRAQARLGSQLQTGDHRTIAEVLGIKPEQVEIETMLAGGSFGRRAQPDMHLAGELAHVAKAIGPGRPVKLVWTREDDIRGGYYRPLTVHRMRGAVREGKIAAWANTIVGQSFVKGSPFAAMIKDGIDPAMVEGARELPYDIGDFRCDVHTVDVGVPTSWWRAVGHTHTAYAAECFLDELLTAAGQDPFVGRMTLLEKSPRHAAVLNAVGRLARWTGAGPFEDRARGVAVVESFGSIVAQIAEVSAGREGVRVHRVWCAIDCGVAVNPDVIRAQMEGGIGFGLGHALFAEVTLEEGRPVQSNFGDYRSLRITEMPQVEVAIVRSNEKPTGVGEPGVPPIAPAVANALARLGVPRPRRLPMARSLAV